ncbi:MAG: hypothetical protein HY898_12525 [Deltaproteobacteria bacterium]|nr:hypothetical protein [Deltaproteobacteria bacterium]
MTCFESRAIAIRTARWMGKAVMATLLLAAAQGCGGGDTTNTTTPPATGGSGGMAGNAGNAGDASIDTGKGGTAGSGGGYDASDGKAGSGGSVPEGGNDADVVVPPDAPDGSDGATVCTKDGDCVGNAGGPYCDTKTGACVECKPADPSTCVVGMYCDAATLKCTPGCDSVDDCSTVSDAGTVTCDPNTHKCVGCVSDDQCPLGLVCKSNSCEPGCTLQHACQSGFSCCASKCVDISQDLDNCGACAKPCTYPNAVAQCTGGNCVIDSCNPGFENCDKNIVNGCETPIPDGGVGCACQPGEVQDCYTGPPNTKDIGVCKGGKATCNNGGNGWGPCVGEVLPTAETCFTPGDDNCNGQVNEFGAGCVCTPNATESCYTGPPGTQAIGACTDGNWTCNAAGTAWGPCTGQVLPTPETCLTPVDDNCNGEVNEAGGAGCQCTPNSTQPCYGGPPGTQNVGTCKGGTQTCDSLGLGYGPCNGDIVPAPDVCTDNLDNDCNGTINDGYSSGAAGCLCFPLAVSTCYTGPNGTQGVGECKSGVAACNAQGSGWGACTGQVVPSTDHCTDSVDNDCNGVINDGFGKGGTGCVCTPNAQQDCYTGPNGTLNVGECKGGKATCNANGQGWGACIGQIIPDLDSCLDTLDNDCNGVVNDGNHLAPGCACAPGSIKCEGNNRRICDAVGDWGPAVSCGGQICSNTLGCVTCLPGTSSCVGNTAHKCKDDGSGYNDILCDPVMGSSCVGGACTGACAPDGLQKSYIGCDYYPTVTVNHELSNTNPTAHFAVAVSNTTATAATVTITQGATTITTVTVAANSVQVINLPWTTLKTTWTATTLLANGAYRLRSTQPVTVYQFNPLEYYVGGAYTYTNDASLLLPTNAWKTDYMVAARNTWDYSYPGFYAVVASEDATSVTLTPSPTGAAVIAGAGVAANGTGTVVLNRGSVLQVLSSGSTANDVTGTIVTATKPIQVIGGHDCTDVPYGWHWCDHIEESMFPIATLGKDYLTTAPSLPGMAQPKTAIVRIIAVETGATALTYDPPGAGPASIAQRGAYVEINTPNSFRVIGDKKLLIAQYMEGQSVGGGSGDPAMALAVPLGQYRGDYLFHAPTSYETNYVNVLAPTGAAVTLDGAALGGFVAIGGTGYSVSRFQFATGGNGTHRLTSNQAVGITVYGYGQYTSYWYPGGLNLSDL